MRHPFIIRNKKIENRNLSIFGNLFSNFFNNPSNRSAFAKALSAPLRTRLDYVGLARKTFLVEQLPEGALPYYTKESKRIDFLKIRGKDLIIKGKFTFPTFQIFNNPTIKIADVKSRRFNIIDSSMQKAKNEIMAQEDSMIFEALDKLGKDNG